MKAEEKAISYIIDCILTGKQPYLGIYTDQHGDMYLSVVETDTNVLERDIIKRIFIGKRNLKHNEINTIGSPEYIMTIIRDYFE